MVRCFSVANQSLPAPESAIVVARSDEACLAVAVRDGIAELSQAVLLRGSAGRILELHGIGLTHDELVAELLRAGSPSPDEAEADARRFLGELRAHGLVEDGDVEPTPEPAPRGADPGDAGAALGVEDVERLAREVLARGLRLRYRALGRSMRPTIPHGSVLDVVARPFADVRVGEVALYSVGETRLVAHRIVGRRGARLLARGDSSARLDRISAADYLGVVRARIAPDGSAVQVSSGPRRMFGLVLGVFWRVGAFVTRHY